MARNTPSPASGGRLGWGRPDQRDMAEGPEQPYRLTPTPALPPRTGEGDSSQRQMMIPNILFPLAIIMAHRLNLMARNTPSRAIRVARKLTGWLGTPLPPRAGEGWDGGGDQTSGTWLRAQSSLTDLPPPRPSPAHGGGRFQPAANDDTEYPLSPRNLSGSEPDWMARNTPSPASGGRLGWGATRPAGHG